MFVTLAHMFVTLAHMFPLSRGGADWDIIQHTTTLVPTSLGIGPLHTSPLHTSPPLSGVASPLAHGRPIGTEKREILLSKYQISCGIRLSTLPGQLPLLRERPLM